LDYIKHIKKEIEDSISVKTLVLSECIEDISRAAEILVRAIRKDKKIYLCGNGGSASDSQHIACELIGRLRKKPISIPAISLATNIPTLTALANDFGYDKVFSKQLEVYANSGDVLIALSTSGKSANVLNTLRIARKLKMRIIAMTGKEKTRLSNTADISIRVPSNDTPRIQEAHIMIGHILASILEKKANRDGKKK